MTSTPSQTSHHLAPITAEEMRIAAAGVTPLPIEQSAPWEELEKARGHRLWGRYEWFENNKRVAIIALYEYDLRGTRYLWAKHGPVWLKEATPSREAAFREDLSREIRQRDSKVAFVRLHAEYSADDLEDVLQIITYDRTVVVDTSGGTAESILESMTTDGRRAIRRAQKKMAEGNAEVVEETQLAAQDFTEYYAVMLETAQRDGFSPHPQEYYSQMLRVLGAEHARLFAVRVGEERELVAWDLVTVYDRQSVAFYGASSSRARTVLAPDALDFAVASQLAAEGVTGGFDLMGAHSPRVPELFTVGKYKKRWAQRYTDVPGAWDMPVKPVRYRAVRSLLKLKRRLRG